MYALQADIFNFQSRLKSDYRFYKAFKSYLISGVSKLRNNKEVMRSINVDFKDLLKHLEVIDIFDTYTPNNQTSENIMYSKIIEAFFKYDLAGYKSDGHFNNMFDDALHTFYAAHFDFFITNDDRCKYKTGKTFAKLGIETRVLKIDELCTMKEIANKSTSFI